MDYAHTRRTRIQWHFNLARHRIFFKPDGSMNPQLRFSLVDDRNRRLPVTEIGRYRFESEEKSFLKLRRGQHLRCRLDKDVILARARVGPLRLLKRSGRG